MHAWTKNEHNKQSMNLTLNEGDVVGDGGEGARSGRPLAKALGGRAHHILQTQVYSGITDEAGGRRAEKMDRKVDRQIDAHHAVHKEQVTSMWAAAWRAVRRFFDGD